MHFYHFTQTAFNIGNTKGVKAGCLFTRVFTGNKNVSLFCFLNLRRSLKNTTCFRPRDLIDNPTIFNLSHSLPT